MDCSPFANEAIGKPEEEEAGSGSEMARERGEKGWKRKSKFGGSSVRNCRLHCLLSSPVVLCPYPLLTRFLPLRVLASFAKWKFGKPATFVTIPTTARERFRSSRHVDKHRAIPQEFAHR